MGFGRRWTRWMEAKIFKCYLSIMFNDRPTKDFTVERGLRQGDPIFPFLFAIVAEGLTSLMKKDVAVGNFKGFSVGEGIFVELIQFADDTLIIGEGSWNDLWSVKAFLRGFELVSGLKVFILRELLVGNRLSIRSKLGWILRRLQFHLWQALMSILKAIDKIRSMCLWEGSEDKSKIHWIKWEIVCSPKENGGLGIKCMEEFNNALLAKWKWRIFNDQNSLWKDTLKARYGFIEQQVITNKLDSRSSFSYWWRDIIKHDLYGCNNRNADSVQAMGDWIQGVWLWGNLGLSEMDQLEKAERIRELQLALNTVTPTVDKQDRIVWRLGGSNKSN